MPIPCDREPLRADTGYSESMFNHYPITFRLKLHGMKSKRYGKQVPKDMIHNQIPMQEHQAAYPFWVSVSDR